MPEFRNFDLASNIGTLIRASDVCATGALPSTPRRWASIETYFDWADQLRMMWSRSLPDWRREGQIGQVGAHSTGLHRFRDGCANDGDLEFDGPADGVGDKVGSLQVGSRAVRGSSVQNLHPHIPVTADQVACRAYVNAGELPHNSYSSPTGLVSISGEQDIRGYL